MNETSLIRCDLYHTILKLKIDHPFDEHNSGEASRAKDIHSQACEKQIAIVMRDPSWISRTDTDCCIGQRAFGVAGAESREGLKKGWSKL